LYVQFQAQSLFFVFRLLLLFGILFKKIVFFSD